MATAPLELLLVDEDEETRNFVRCLLPANYIVHEAARGRVALELVQRHLPDCILLNWWLPDIEVLPLIQLWSAAHIPVIVLTRESFPQMVAPAMAQGAQGYLLKDQLSTGLLEQVITDAQADAKLK